MINKLYVYANTGQLDKLPVSGGQSSARRVIKGLEEMGMNIVPIKKHRNKLIGKIKHKTEAFLFIWFDMYKIIRTMLFGHRKNTAFLFLTYAGSLVPYELYLSVLIKLLGYKSIIYWKGGKILDYYIKGSNSYRWMFIRTMNLQTACLFEGKDGLDLVKAHAKPLLVYFPNYLADEHIPLQCPQKPSNEWNIMYFGRINKQKNVLAIIEAFNRVSTMLPNQKIRLTLIGGGGHADYLKKVDEAIASSPYRTNIERYGLSPFDFIKEKMQSAHFFLFPTETKAEGHSNALNEAMSQGLVPVVSNLHFNASIVGNDKFVVEGYNPQDYADRIVSLIKSGEMANYSLEVWERVKRLYAKSVVLHDVAEQIKNL